jgi:hypothetical protein
MGTKRKLPTGPVKALRSSAMMIRVTDVQRRAFERRASMSGLSTSSWARMILLRQVSREELEEGDEK